MLWMVKTLLVFGKLSRYSVFSSSGTSAACQSWQCTTSGCKPINAIEASVAFAKYA